MKERPILMCGEMVRAVLDDRKTQTRRIMDPQLTEHDFGPGGIQPAFMPPLITNGFLAVGLETMLIDNFAYLKKLPYGWTGDRLWVKETFCAPGAFGVHGRKLFAANPGDDAKRPRDELGKPHHWTPSIFMPRAASRITLEITKVGVERLNDISEADARAEGTTPSIVGDELDDLKYRAGYQTLWESINGAGSWSQNPWVWVVSFKRIPQPQ